ncbi:MAG: hypothetical protein ACJ79G_15430 [Myxococcales bacterium]
MTSRICLVAMLIAAAPARAFTAEELVQKNIDARGGLEKLRALRSLRLTGKVLFGSDSPIEARYGQLIARPGLYREETTLQGLTAVDAWDGKEAWRLQPFGGRRDPFRASADDAKELAQSADLDGPLVDWKEKGNRIEFLGSEDVDGTEALKLRVVRKDGDVVTYFLDEDTFLAIRELHQRQVRGTERLVEVDIGSYTDVGGVLVPFSIESGPLGAPKTTRVTIERGEANVPVDEAFFRFPAAGTKVGLAIIAGPPPTQAPPGNRAAPGKSRAAVFDSGVLSGLGARNIGSAAMSGRVSAVAARTDDGKTTVYVGAASGGVWKSFDGGTTFKPVFDKQPVQSIGAIAIDPSDARTIWVGTGEAWTRNSVSIGDGIYRSTDGGETWTNMGLRESERIARIVVDPRDGKVVYACVPGKLWSDSAERGLFKTADGGKTWSQILRGPNLSTGCSSVSMDAKNPEVLFAALWDFRRKGWTFRSGGEGADATSGSALLRSADGGKTWTEVSKGLGPKPYGRIEVAIAPSNSRVVYAFVESTDSALYRSSDGGETWEARDRSQNMVWRPFYFARLVVDPTNPERLFKTNLRLIVSDDGGRSFTSAQGRAHGDWHDLWIDPANPKHILGGDDGGFWMSYDGGSRWWKSNNLPISQFYHVSVDAKDPYQVYGGLQDNSSWVGDSSYPGGISNQRWENLYGGDGFWAVPDPSDPNAVYAESQGGYIGRVDRARQSIRDIQPKALYKEKLRFNWNSPIHASATQKGVIYIGAQFLFRSRDRGDNWERISPDLTTNDPEKQKQEESGGVTVDNSSAEMHTTIYSISESPLDARTIWVGTDDGNVQLTRDGGKTWTNVAPNVGGLPAFSWASWIEASRFDKATAYAAFDRHTFGDMTPWVYRTTDYGRTWTRIVSKEKGVRGYVHVVKEDAVKKDLLFCGTEFGLWVSIDGGSTWAEFKGNGFPGVAVREVQVQSREGDLVLATHGRGIWIVDDLSPLRALTGAVLAQEATFLPGRPAQQRMQGSGGWVEGDATFVGENPSGGAVITYYQRARHVYGPMRLEVFDGQGKLVESLSPSKRRGIARVTWSMLLKPPRVPRAAQVAFSASQGPRVLPGTYTVRLTKGATVVETRIEVKLDRRAPYDVAARKQQFDAMMEMYKLFADMSALVDRLESAQNAAEAREKQMGSGDALSARLRAVREKVADVRKQIVATKEGGAVTGEERIREHADILYGALNTWEGRPGKYQVERLSALKRELEDARREFDGLVASGIRPVNDELRSKNLDPIPTDGPLPGAASLDRLRPDELAAVECAREFEECAVERGVAQR